MNADPEDEDVWRPIDAFFFGLLLALTLLLGYAVITGPIDDGSNRLYTPTHG